ncbi:MAG: hypothetical protein MJ166_09265 [Clostridia bacterium]|nr:hypothetical protein [Clostridia bacterium]
MALNTYTEYDIEIISGLAVIDVIEFINSEDYLEYNHTIEGNVIIIDKQDGDTLDDIVYRHILTVRLLERLNISDYRIIISGLACENDSVVSFRIESSSNSMTYVSLKNMTDGIVDAVSIDDYSMTHGIVVTRESVSETYDSWCEQYCN